MRIGATLLALCMLALAPEAAAQDEAEPSEDAAQAEGAADAPDEVAVAASAEVDAPPDLEQEQAEAREAEPAPEPEGERLDHEYQVGLRFGAGVPFLFALRYGASTAPNCDRDARQFCVAVGSGVMDLDLSFGVTRDLEITLMGRYGMAGTYPTENNDILIGLGIRSYVGVESVVKGFFGVRAILDLTPAGVAASWTDVDAGVRGEAGLQVDIVRYFGLYAQIGVNITFIRALAIAPDVTGGLQLRAP